MDVAGETTTQKIIKPKVTRRYCINCDRMRTFIYNRIIGHSECSECGLRASLREAPEPPRFEQERLNLENKVKQLEIQIKQLKHDNMVLERMVEARDNLLRADALKVLENEERHD